MLLQDFRFNLYETLDEALSDATIVNGLVVDSLDVHAIHLIRTKRIASKLRMYFEINKSEVQGYERFLKIKIWHLKEKKLINNYFLELKKIIIFSY